MSMPPLPKPTPLCQGRFAGKRCGAKAVAKRETHPRFVCESCLKLLPPEGTSGG
jgi:hypothetical protein